jgi:phosphoesterase RecJ-like protein
LYRFLPHLSLCNFLTNPSWIGTYDAAISLDCSDERYVESVLAKLPSRPKLLNIDHHASNPIFGDASIVKTHACATGEIVFDLLRSSGFSLTPSVATALLTSLCFDTMFFRNAGTKPRACQIAAELVRCGASFGPIVRGLNQKSSSVILLWGIAFSRLIEQKESGICATWLTIEDLQRCGVNEEEIEGLSNFLSLTLNMGTVCVIRERPNGEAKVSLRSRDRDVGSFAAAQGGGGHRAAAGFQSMNKNLVRDQQQVYSLIEEVASKAPLISL